MRSRQGSATSRTPTESCSKQKTYTWLRCDANGDNCDTVIGTGSTYTLTDAEVGLRIKVRFGFRDNEGNVESRTSASWPASSEDPIAALVVLDATGAPSISGRAKTGATVTAGLGDVADPDGIDESTLSYTWLRCDANGASCNVRAGERQDHHLAGRCRGPADQGQARLRRR